MTNQYRDVTFIDLYCCFNFAMQFLISYFIVKLLNKICARTDHQNFMHKVLQRFTTVYNHTISLQCYSTVNFVSYIIQFRRESPCIKCILCTMQRLSSPRFQHWIILLLHTQSVPIAHISLGFAIFFKEGLASMEACNSVRDNPSGFCSPLRWPPNGVPKMRRGTMNTVPRYMGSSERVPVCTGFGRRVYEKAPIVRSLEYLVGPFEHGSPLNGNTIGTIKH